MTTIEKIQSLLAQNKISVYKLSKEIGLNKTFLTNWTSGKAKPSADALSKNRRLLPRIGRLFARTHGQSQFQQ